MSHHPPYFNRRRFLAGASASAAAAFAAPSVIPASALGRDGNTAPSERIVMGAIGTGGRGRFLLRRFLAENDAQLVAACDVDKRHLRKGVAEINKAYGNKDCQTHHDFRELVSRDDLDAVIVATPDHWHALASIAAADTGLDIYCEKPLANTVAESRAIVDAVQRNNRILQVGTHERSRDNCRFACELVRNGRIGELKALRVNLPDNQDHHKKAKQMKAVPETMPVPEPFDYDFWLGHTAEVPYTERRCHFWWRFNLSYGGGEMTDRGAHVIDIGQLGAGKDRTGPVRLSASGSRDADSLYNVFWDYSFEAEYADGLKLIGGTDQPRGVKFEGTDGWIFVHIHGGKLEAEPKSLLQQKVGDDGTKLGRSPGHQRNFLDSVKSRTEPMAPAYAGHHTAVICHLTNMAMLAGGETVEWDPVHEQATNSEHVNRLLSPTMREPWSL